MKQLGVLVLFAASVASAEPHRGSLGLTVAAGGAYTTVVGAAGGSDVGGRFPLELGGTLGLFEHTDLRLAGRLSPGVGSALGSSLYAGVRNSFYLGDWATFVDVDFAAHLTPYWTLGARAAFGVQYDFLPIMGVYAQLGAQIGGGSALRLSFEGLVGLQFRTYLF